MSKRTIVIGIAILALLVAGVAMFKFVSPMFGSGSGPTHYQKESFLEGLFIGNSRQVEVKRTGTLRIGDNGSNFAELKATTCNLIGSDASQAATSTVAYDCAVTGIASGDVVMAQLATSTGRLGGTASWFISGAMASTTDGYATIMLTNFGSAAVPSVTSVGSSTNIWYGDI